MRNISKFSSFTSGGSARTPKNEQIPSTSTPPRATPASFDGMTFLDGGSFFMGSDSPDSPETDGEGPVREVVLSPFHIDACAVTNRKFAAFVEATGYKTDAEISGTSLVFHLLVPKLLLTTSQARTLKGMEWWLMVEGACWRRPEGPGTDIYGRLDHPAVHISWIDAAAYCSWAGKRLPTEAEWEYAARGGLVLNLYPWGNELTPGGRHRCNIWQGDFPNHNTAEDGYIGTAPVRFYQPNAYGLYNMCGNVWEWCADWFSSTHHQKGPRVDPRGPLDGDLKLAKGGSYLCHNSYCNRYRVSARTGNKPEMSSGNFGFRCARDA